MYRYSYNGFYKQFSEDEMFKIIDFIENVNLRTNSGTGTNISKNTVRNSFFECPEAFRKITEMAPNDNLWRGDQDSPCSSIGMKYHLEFGRLMQSFSTKGTAEFFGHVVFPSKTIKQYGGSFSTEKFNKINKLTDDWFLSAAAFYFKTKEDGLKYNELFTLSQFFAVYYALNGKGVIGRKYGNWLKKYLLKTYNLDYDRDNYKYDTDMRVGDDEGEVMFFDVDYDCDLMNKFIENSTAWSR